MVARYVRREAPEPPRERSPEPEPRFTDAEWGALTRALFQSLARDRVFACIPREVGLDPPLRRRGEPASVGLSVFEFAVAVGCARLARRGLNRARHEFARRAAKDDIHAAREKSDHGPRGHFEAIGSDAYWRHHAEFRPPDHDHRVRRTVSGLLVAAGVSRNQGNAQALSAALDRLMRPIGRFPPVVIGWRATPDGTLTLTVDRWWVPLDTFARIPWPSANKGPTVLALYLFLFAADHRPGSKTISEEELCKRLSVGGRPSHMKRRLARALVAVNAHLHRLNVRGQLDEHELPRGFELVPSPGGTRLSVRADIKRRPGAADLDGNLDGKEPDEMAEQISSTTDPHPEPRGVAEDGRDEAGEKDDDYWRRNSRSGEDGAGCRKFERRVKRLK